MREAAFVKQSKPRWEEFEKIVKNQQSADPDRLAELFIQVTDDLSFARTKYPNTRTESYLNSLAAKIHLRIYKNKRESRSRFVVFWKEEIPQAMWEARKPMMYALLMFVVFALMGAVSTLNDDTFVRLIMGDEYVNMTLQNIEEGNPTGVYQDMHPLLMFMYITWNNVLVSFRIFAYGLGFSIGTAYELFRNSIMLGSFITFFYKENQLSVALPVIMLHGTIELTSIVIAAGAGFTMGNGIVFPGTYPRLESFKIGAKRGLKIVIGLVPFFIIASFIESFITRFAGMHWSVKAVIIGMSAAVMIYYFVVYPYKRRKYADHSNH
jgi:uncharacterized membrane protein SpoIIM required for sporulation